MICRWFVLNIFTITDRVSGSKICSSHRRGPSSTRSLSGRGTALKNSLLGLKIVSRDVTRMHMGNWGLHPPTPEAGYDNHHLSNYTTHPRPYAPLLSSYGSDVYIIFSAMNILQALLTQPHPRLQLFISPFPQSVRNTHEPHTPRKAN